MKLLRYITSAVTTAFILPLAACSESDPVTNPPVQHTPVTIERGTFAKGADVSWVTQMEAEGIRFYNADKVETECMQLLRDQCGVNSIRLRVWVNPAEGWNNIGDVVVKARRANDLGLRLMIDFHFSDTWADPGNQKMPRAWWGLDIEGVKLAMAEHVTDMLSRLKELGIEPEWVQIGNETSAGMMLPMGSIVDNPQQYAALNNAGYDAVKAIFPEALCIVHLDSGQNRWRYERMFDALATHGGRYDMIGMSLYPYSEDENGVPGDWQKVVDDTLDNITYLKGKYGKPVIICEVGMPYNKPAECKSLISQLMQAPVEGVFYWEPEAPAGYNNGYGLGCFANGTPTIALDAFKN